MSDLESGLTTSPGDSRDLPALDLVRTDSAGDERRSHEWDLAAGATNYAALAGGHVLGIVCSLLSVWLGTRILGPSGYGHLALLVAASMLLTVTLNWTATSVVRFGVREFVDTGRIARIFWTRSVVLAVNLLLILATSPLWLRPLSEALRVPLFLAPLLLLHLTAAVLWYHMQQSLMAAKLPKINAALLTFERATIVVVLLALIARGTVSLRTVVAVYIAAPALAAGIALIVLRRMIFPREHIRSERVRAMLRFSAPLLPSAFVAYFSTSYLDSFFIASFMDAAAVGVYAVGYQFAGANMMLIILAGSLLQPFFISVAPEMQEQRMRLHATRVLPVITVGWSLATVIGAAVGGPLLLRILGPQYAELQSILWPMMASLAVGAPALAGYFPIAYATGRTSLIAINSLIAAILNVALDIVLIPRYGLIGCAWATFITYVVALSVMTFLFDRALKTRSWWNAVATLPAIAAMVVAMDGGTLAAISAAAVVAVMIVTPSRRQLAEGASILLRVIRWRKD